MRSFQVRLAILLLLLVSPSVSKPIVLMHSYAALSIGTTEYKDNLKVVGGRWRGGRFEGMGRGRGGRGRGRWSSRGGRR